MPKSKARKLHIDITPPVGVEIEGHHIAFVGLNFLHDKVMVEYDVTPPIEHGPFGPHLLILEVTDDTGSGPYETFWLDFPWFAPGSATGRMTTRLERRPPAEATALQIVVRPVEPADESGHRPWTSSLRPVRTFRVKLPPEHGLPWPTAAPPPA